jgi:hypothetical protein
MPTWTLGTSFKSGANVLPLRRVTLTYPGEISLDPPINPASADVPVACTVAVAQIKGVYLYSDAAVTIETNSPGVDEVQRLTAAGTPTAGTFTSTFSGQTTAGIAWNAAASAVQSALEAMSNVAPGDVVCTGGPLPGTPVDVKFTGATWGQRDVPAMTTNSAGLTGGTVGVTTPTPGVAPSDTIALAAGKPRAWYAGSGEACPFTVDVTGLYITNVGADQANVAIRILTNP